MRAIDLVGGVEIMAPEDCLVWLGNNHIGRLGVVVDGRAEIFPVNYTFDGDVIMFASNEGRKLLGLLAGQVTFEVDSIDERAQAGWSVVVHGVVESVVPYDRGEESSGQPWSGAKDFLVRIRPETMTGRQVVASFWQGLST
jgi:nitroimidazol reductase NimA-like FMN-containing flavoprotein (pyridoxamine 5'-phosphate oxidase superfamily)